VTLDRWVPFREESGRVRYRLFCFPHAGGNAIFYRPLRRFMPPEIDFCPVELPGRAARLNEPPFTSMGALIEQLHLALQPLLEVPFGFFGHSVGAWIACEAAGQLHSVEGRTAANLFVSGRAAPRRGLADSAPPRRRTESELLAILKRFGGTPAAIMQRPELISALLPALGADFDLAERYAAAPGDRIGCPITAFGGADDVLHSGSLESWRDFTRGRFRTCIFPGTHFYFSQAAEALAGEIIRDLQMHPCVQAAGAEAAPPIRSPSVHN
jgi:medium-chain acyl-[acyl-carrier-protein] hydrolase